MTAVFVDASVLAAILLNERDAQELTGRLLAFPRRATSPMAVWEATIAVHKGHLISVDEAEDAVEALLKAVKIEVEPIPPEIRKLAIAAFDRFGKGRHAAALNFGDCFAYACARHASVPLLYKGDDFSRTDIEAA